MELKLADCVTRIAMAPISAINAQANALMAAGKDIISLNMGEPDFDTPDHIKEAAIKAVKAGATKYTAVDGTAALKEAICQKFLKENTLKYDPAQILVSCGAKHSLYNLFATLLNAGDEVIFPAPCWVGYFDIVKYIGAVPVIIKTDADQHYKITAEQLETAITAKTRLIVLNSPSNPSGVAYNKNELAALGRILAQHPDIIVANDDIYEHNQWNGAFINIVMACPDLYEQCVIVNGVSKAYAMTGWRIGYAAGPVKIINAMKVIQSQITLNPCSISQAAALAALTGDQACTAIMTKAYKERHDYIVNELQQIPGVKCLPADGTFYCLPDIKAVIAKAANINNDIEFMKYLLEKAGVTVVPGAIFGAPGHVRISYASSMDKIKEGIHRLRLAVETLTS